MDYEKKYKEALEWARKVMQGKTGFVLDEVLEKFPELKESEDEIRKELIRAFKSLNTIDVWNGIKRSDILAWLEKQGKHANFLSKIQVGDKVTRNEDGVLVNLSQLNRIAKKDEKQGSQILANSAKTCKDEQKSDDKVEPKFYKGEWLCENEPNNYARFIQILETVNVLGKERYRISRDIHNDEDIVEFDFVEKYYHKFDIKDAQDGDVLVIQKTDVTYESIFIFKKIENNCIIQYLHYFTTDAGEEVCEARSIDGFLGFVESTVYPATKEQRELLFKKMKEAGYEWGARKKELKKIEDEEYNGEDYGIDSLYHAKRILEKTLGKVDGYQSDDGILEHKCAITAVKKLYEQKPAWSEEDEKVIDCIEEILYSHLDYVKEDIRCTKRERKETKENFDKCINWLKSLKPQNWTKEDKERYISCLQRLSTGNPAQPETINSKWFKEHVYPQKQWKPSDEQMDAIKDAIDYLGGNTKIVQKYLMSLYEDLKKLREE